MAVGGVVLLCCAAFAELTIRQYRAVLPGLRTRAPLLRRLNVLVVVGGILSLVMAVLIPRL